MPFKRTIRHQIIHLRRMARGSQRIPLIIRLMALGKVAKAAGFLLPGLAVAKLVKAPDLQLFLTQCLDRFHIDPDGEHAHRLVAWLSGVPQSRLTAVGFGAFAYTALYLIEGLGLWFDRSWAEYLVVVATAISIPFEIQHLVHRFSWGLSAATVLNVLVVAYLVRRIRQRKGHATGAPPAGSRGAA